MRSQEGVARAVAPVARGTKGSGRQWPCAWCLGRAAPSPQLPLRGRSQSQLPGHGANSGSTGELCQPESCPRNWGSGVHGERGWGVPWQRQLGQLRGSREGGRERWLAERAWAHAQTAARPDTPERHGGQAGPAASTWDLSWKPTRVLTLEPSRETGRGSALLTGPSGGSALTAGHPVEAGPWAAVRPGPALT